MIKTAIISEHIDPARGGAESSALELLTTLNNSGIEAEMLTADPQTDIPHVKGLCPSSRKRSDITQFYYNLRRHLQNNPYDIVHSFLPLPFADIYQPRGGSYKQAAIQNAKSFQNRAMVWIKSQTHFLNMNRTAMLRAEKQLCKNPSVMIAALSEMVKNHFMLNYNLPPERLKVIPNGINTDIRINNALAHDIQTKALEKLTADNKKTPALFLFAANNFRLKGLRPLLFALQKALAKKPDNPPSLIIAGAGPIKKFSLLAEKLNIQNNIYFLGHLPSIQNAISICTAAVLPTYYDPCSRFILEAIALDKPVITTKFNGAAERYTHNRHGIIIDSPDNTEALCNGLLHFTKPENVNAAAIAIREDNLIDSISITTHVQQLKKLYQTILDKRKR